MSGDLELGLLSQVAGPYRMASSLALWLAMSMSQALSFLFFFFYLQHIRGRAGINTHGRKGENQ